MKLRVGGLSWGASLLVLALIFWIAFMSSSDASAEGLSIGYGPTFVSNDSCGSGALTVSQTFGEHWEAIMFVVDEGTCWTKQTGLQAGGGLIGGGIQRVAVSRSGRWAASIGLGVWEKDSLFFGDADGVRDDIQLSGLLGVERRIRCRWLRFAERCAWAVHHASTASSTPTNKGLNILGAFRVTF